MREVESGDNPCGNTAIVRLLLFIIVGYRCFCEVQAVQLMVVRFHVYCHCMSHIVGDYH